MKRYKCAHSDCEAVKEKDPCILTFGDDPVAPDRCPFGNDGEFMVWKKVRMTTDAVKILKKRYLRKKQ